MGVFGAKHADKALDIIDKLVVDKDKKQDLAAKVVERELEDGDLFTKRARPSIIYIGLFVILTEIFGIRFWMLTWMDATEIVLKQSNAMLEYFLFTWGGLVTIYIGGRTYEKRKQRLFNKN